MREKQENREERAARIQEDLRKPQVHHSTCCCTACKPQERT